MKKVLITGASGFIGSHVVEEVASRGMKPVIFDRYYNHEVLSQLPDHDFVKGDIRDAEVVMEAVQVCDYVINLAGILGTQETIRKPIPSVQTNIIGGLNVLEACVPSPFHNVRGVQIGVGNHWMNNSYSITKSAMERLVWMYNKENGTKVSIVRGLNAYGTRQKHKPVRKITPTFIVKALRGEDIEVYGDGSQIMDMIFVKDLAKILVDAVVIDHGLYQDHVFEAGTGRETTVNWIAQQVIEAVKNAGFETKSKVVHLPMRPGEPDHAVVKGDPTTLEPLEKARGMKYELTPFEKGIADTVKWYISNYDWQP